MRSYQQAGVWLLILGAHATLLGWLGQGLHVRPAVEVSWIDWAVPPRPESSPAPQPGQRETVPQARSAAPSHLPEQRPQTRLQPTATPTAPPTAAPTIAPTLTSQLPANNVSEASASAPAAPAAPGQAGASISGASVPASAGASSQAEPVTLPSHSAAYLNNPPPAYPAISKRLGEQGRVVVRVLIDEQGRPQQAQLQTESGYARLDRAALDAVMGWRFVPGQRGGKAQAMWFSVPITFDLKPARD